MDSCTLCVSLKTRLRDSGFLFETETLAIFMGPFSARWPGSLMVVFKRHSREITDLNTELHARICSELYAFEKAIRTHTRCAKFNLVKFGNICEHLHWHLIPRYRSEAYGQKSPWEIGSIAAPQLYIDNILPPAVYSEIVVHCKYFLAHKIPPWFSSALFLRPSLQHRSINFADWDITSILNAARTFPEQWECFLMQRNYKDFSWDSFGGGADARERPDQTLKREIQEELGWELKSYQEICRQWDFGLLRGFVYLAIPTEPTWYFDNPSRLPCNEVRQARYHSLEFILNSSEFQPKVKGRIRALLDSEKDFDCKRHT